MSPIRTALLGFGNSGRHYHAPRLMDHPQFELTVVARSSGAPVPLPGVETVQGWEAALDRESIDAAVIALPHDLHAPAAEAALDAGLHVLVEKPMTLNRATAERLARRALEHDRVLMVHHQRRWEQDYCELLRLVRAGAVGTPWRIAVTRSHQGNYVRTAADRPHAGDEVAAWAHQRGRGGGVAQVIGPHSVDHILRLAEEEVAEVQARGHRAAGEDVEDWIGIDLTFPSGLTGTVEIFRRSRIAPPRFLVYGDEGTAIAADGTSVRIVRDHQENLVVEGLERPGVLGHEIYRDFAEAVSGEHRRSSIEEAIAVVDVLERADQQLVRAGVLPAASR